MRTDENGWRAEQMLEMGQNEMQGICGHAAREYPRECCGILLGKREAGQVLEIHPAANADRPDRQGRHFLIHPLELYRVETEADRKDMEIVGFYHSHPDCPAFPSQEDCSSMLPGYCYLIVSVVDGVCREVSFVFGNF